MGRRSPVCLATRMYSSSVGHDEGSIMAIIIACHMRRKKSAEAPSDRPGIAIHIIGMVHPPGIGMPSDIPRAIAFFVFLLAAVCTIYFARAHSSARSEGEEAACSAISRALVALV